MTTTSDFTRPQGVALEPARIVDGGRMIARAICRLSGAALMLAAVGLWLAPGASWESDLMLFKLLLCVCAVLAGLGFLQAGSRQTAPHVQVDPIRRQVRLMRPGKDGRLSVLRQSSFADLQRAEINGTCVRFIDGDHNLLAELTIDDARVLGHLKAGLRDEGKLA